MARKTNQIADLFASVGFKVDKGSIKALDASLRQVEKRLASIVKSFKGVNTKGLTGALRNTARDSGKAAAGIDQVTAKLKNGLPAVLAYTQQMRVLAAELRSVTGAAPTLPRIPSGGRGGSGGATGGGYGGSQSYSSQRTGFFSGLASGLFGTSGSGFIRGLMPGIGAGWAVMHSTQRAREMIANEAAFGALTGSQEGGKAEYKYLQQFSNTYGMRSTDAAGGYKRILASAAGTKLEGAGAKSIFEGVALYGKALGLSDENMSRATTAISQMISKGTIMSEELKGQLAEATPGAVQIFAKAITGGDVSKLFKMMEKGEVKAADVMERVAEAFKEAAHQGGALEKMMKTSASEQARFVNAWDEFLKTVFESGLDEALATLFSILTKVLNTLGGFVKMVKDGLSAVPDVVWKIVGAFAAFKVIALAIPFAKIIGSFLLFQKAMNPTWYKKPLLLTFLLLLLAVLEDIAYWRAGKGSLIGDLFGSWEDVTRKFDPFFAKFDAWVDNIKAGVTMLRDFLIDIGVLQAKVAPAGQVVVNKPSLSEGAGKALSNRPGILKAVPGSRFASLAYGAISQAIENKGMPSYAPAGGPAASAPTFNMVINGVGDPEVVAQKVTDKIVSLTDLSGISSTTKR